MTDDNEWIRVDEFAAFLFLFWYPQVFPTLVALTSSFVHVLVREREQVVERTRRAIQRNYQQFGELLRWLGVGLGHILLRKCQTTQARPLTTVVASYWSHHWVGNCSATCSYTPPYSGRGYAWNYFCAQKRPVVTSGVLNRTSRTIMIVVQTIRFVFVLCSHRPSALMMSPTFKYWHESFFSANKLARSGCFCTTMSCFRHHILNELIANLFNGMTRVRCVWQIRLLLVTKRTSRSAKNILFATHG